MQFFRDRRRNLQAVPEKIPPAAPGALAVRRRGDGIPSHRPPVRDRSFAAAFCRTAGLSWARSLFLQTGSSYSRSTSAARRIRLPAGSFT